MHNLNLSSVYFIFVAISLQLVIVQHKQQQKNLNVQLLDARRANTTFTFQYFFGLFYLLIILYDLPLMQMQYRIAHLHC